MLQERIANEFLIAFKGKDILKKDTLNILKARISAWKSSKENAKKELTDNEIINLINSEIKKRNQAIEIYKSNPAASANLEKEEKEKAILQTLLPEQMSEGEILSYISKIATEMKEAEQPISMLLPNTMKYFNSNFKGQFDNQQVLNLVKEFSLTI